MLDNVEPKSLIIEAEQLKRMYPNVLVEASGGISLANVASYASEWVDIISSSSLVQGYSTIDFSMKIQ